MNAYFMLAMFSQALSVNLGETLTFGIVCNKHHHSQKKHKNAKILRAMLGTAMTKGAFTKG